MTATTAYSKIDLTKLSQTLRALPPKPPEEKPVKIDSARKIIAVLFEEIGGLRDKGYKFPDIQQILAKRKIKLSSHTLRRYWFEEKALRKAAKSKRKKAKAS